MDNLACSDHVRCVSAHSDRVVHGRSIHAKREASRLRRAREAHLHSKAASSNGCSRRLSEQDCLRCFGASSSTKHLSGQSDLERLLHRRKTKSGSQSSDASAAMSPPASRSQTASALTIAVTVLEKTSKQVRSSRAWHGHHHDWCCSLYHIL